MKKDNRLLQNIFQSAYPQLIKKKHPLKDLKAIDAIVNCQTEAQGYHYLSCPKGHEIHQQNHSCRHRSCPLCSEKSKHDWIEAQKHRLLNCPHHHVIFTLPHEYIPLWLYNRKWMTQHFFKACRDTLITLLKDERYLNATPGILMTLHTWGRQLTMHPHMHCLVTSGGLNENQQWCPTTNDFLVPIHVIKALFRGKMQSYIKEAFFNNELRLPEDCDGVEFMKIHRSVFKKQWSIRIQEQYSHGRGVMLYLARYIKGGPLNPKQITQLTSKHLEFRYKDHRDKKTKQLRLSITEFIRRILWHVPEPGLHVVRYYGVYATQARQKLDHCRVLLGDLKQELNSSGKEIKDTVQWYCGICGALMQRVYTHYQSARKGNSFISVSRSRHVQQYVQPALGHGTFFAKSAKKSPCPRAG